MFIIIMNYFKLFLLNIKFLNYILFIINIPEYTANKSKINSLNQIPFLCKILIINSIPRYTTVCDL